MALNVPADALSEILGDTKHNPRRDTWLWFFLSWRGGNFRLDEFGASTMRDRLASFISSNEVIKQDIRRRIDSLILPDEHFRWISRDDRQIAWLIQHIDRMYWNGTFPRPPRLLGRDLVVAMIDVLELEPTDKVGIIRTIENSWHHHRHGDQSYKWFSGKDEVTRCECAWEWLQMKKPYLVSNRAPIRRHDEILMFFDQINLSDAERILTINAIKKRWSQQKFREKMTGKKQYNFILSDKAIRGLDEIAQAYDLKRTQVLEILIKMEIDRGIYISERMKTLKNL